jgi:hypothetical protein
LIPKIYSGDSTELASPEKVYELGDGHDWALDVWQTNRADAHSTVRADGNAFALQKLLGHTTLHTTHSYLAMTTDVLITEHREHSSVDAMLRRGR